jgi:hypothetical protein
MTAAGAEVVAGDLETTATIDAGDPAHREDHEQGLGDSPIARRRDQAAIEPGLIASRLDDTLLRITDDVPSVIARPARTFAHFAEEQAAAFS